MTKEKTLVFDATVRDVFNLTLKQIPNLRPLLDEMGKLTPANRRSYKALLHVVATEHNLRTAGKPGEQQKLALPEPEKPQVRTPSKAEKWADLMKSWSQDLAKQSDRDQHVDKKAWHAPTVIWSRVDGGTMAGLQIRDGLEDFLGLKVACKTHLLYLAPSSLRFIERKAELPNNRSLLWGCERLPLYGGGPVTQPDRPKDEYEDNQWFLFRPVDGVNGAEEVLFRTAVHATKLDTDLLTLASFWSLSRWTVTKLTAEEYLAKCLPHMTQKDGEALANKLKLPMPQENT